MAGGDPVEASAPAWWQQILRSQRREAQRIQTEFAAVRGLMPLLMKARNGGHWSLEEKEEIISHLRRMAHLSPYLIVLMLPGSVFLLPAYAWWLDRRRLNRRD
ncbi:hypothetical protein [Quatrionicoccus australiensis]|uniref:hypothetical protein n=1 Tax=Quatrionicoccus australiensis TaxID=138118 RepID=UPI001CFB03E7|nr:hypothetical protein [Quatrionicoccus australiensis]MCB4360149.1 hypothetical protein [Quatrionicoccus australiensis]